MDLTEKIGSRPLYFPGDVVKAKDGSIGIITEAGCGGVEWNEFEEITERMANGMPPQYALDSIPGFKLSKSAWWQACEWSEVLKGPLHQVLEGSKTWQKNLLRLEAAGEKRLATERRAKSNA